MIRKHQRGVTLIELLFTIGLGSIVAVMFFNALQAQKRVFLQSLDRTEGMQNGRAALSVVKKYVRYAGWGFRMINLAGISQPQGVVPIGSCADPSVPKNVSYTACDCGPTPTTCKSDSIRIVYIDPTSYTESLALPDISGGSLQVRDTATHLQAGDLAIISGICATFPYTELLTVTNATFDTVAKTATYTISRYSDGSATCPSSPNYAAGAAFGKAILVDLYIDRSNSLHPELRTRQWTGNGTATISTVAYDIDDLQARYGIDTTLPDPDGRVATSDWCNNVSDSSAPSGGGCGFSGLSTADKLGRIVATKVGIVVRSRDYKPLEVYKTPPAAFTFSPWNVSLQTHGDGYFRWVFRATIASRNKDM